ncbi:hypothetical protein C2E23DRAFT_890318 [Lenzites betulinus]|nr:hypothetical protein C2E23DRAFT_890318 [Lenzites betulinus]
MASSSTHPIDSTTTDTSPTLEIPVYIHLPLHPDTGERRQLLVTVYIRRVDSRRTTIDATWDEIATPHPYQPAPMLPRPSAPQIDGVLFFMPRNAMISPIYIVVSRVFNVRLRARLLIAISVNEWIPTDDDTLRVDVDARHLDNGSRAARAIALLPPDADTLRAIETLYNNADALRALLARLPELSYPTISPEPLPYIPVNINHISSNAMDGPPTTVCFQITLPRINAEAQTRFLIITAFITKTDARNTCFTATTAILYSDDERHRRAGAAIQIGQVFDGVTPFIPNNALLSPIYAIVHHIDGQPLLVEMDIGRLNVEGMKRIIHIHITTYRVHARRSIWIDSRWHEFERPATSSFEAPPPPSGVSIFRPRNPLQYPTYIVIDHMQDLSFRRPIIIVLRANEWLPGVEDTIDVRIHVMRAAHDHPVLTTAPDDIRAMYPDPDKLMNILSMSPLNQF